MVQRDPMDYATAMSVYEYCGSNPVKRHDPSGLDWWPPYLWGEDLDSHHRMLAKYSQHNARSAANRERKLERELAQAKTEKLKDKAALERLWREIERAREIRGNALYLAATSRRDALAAGERGFQEGWVDATLGLSQGLEETFSLGGRLWDPVDRSRHAYTRSSFEFARSGGHVAGVATLGAFGLTAAGELGVTQVGNVPLTQIPAQIAAEATALAEGARRLHADEAGACTSGKGRVLRTFEDITVRSTLGADGGTSMIVKTKNAVTGETLKVVHRVVDAVGKVIHEDVKFVKP